MSEPIQTERSFSAKILTATSIILFTLLILTIVYFLIDVVFLVFSAVLFAILLRGLAIPIANRLKIGKDGRC